MVCKKKIPNTSLCSTSGEVTRGESEAPEVWDFMGWGALGPGAPNQPSPPAPKGKKREDPPPIKLGHITFLTACCHLT